jgi:hypothetical protein
LLKIFDKLSSFPGGSIKKKRFAYNPKNVNEFTVQHESNSSGDFSSIYPLSEPVVHAVKRLSFEIGLVN